MALPIYQRETRERPERGQMDQKDQSLDAEPQSTCLSSLIIPLLTEHAQHRQQQPPQSPSEQRPPPCSVTVATHTLGDESLKRRGWAGRRALWGVRAGGAGGTGGGQGDRAESGRDQGVDYL